MDFNLQRERIRINKIISKITCNYSSPISLAKQTLNKLTRHRKVYSFGAEQGKVFDGKIQSVRELITKPIDLKEKEEKIEQMHERNSEAHRSIPHTFTFQTLREVLANNPDGSHGLTTNHEESDTIVKSQRKREKKKKGKFDGEFLEKVYTEYSHNKIKHLPAMSEFVSFRHKSPTFLRDISNKSKRRILKTNFENKNKHSRFMDGFLAECYIKALRHESEETVKMKPDSIFQNEMLVSSLNNDLNSRTRDLKYHKHDALQDQKGKVINITLPKTIKLSYFSENKKISLLKYKEDDTSIRGWEKITPLDLLEHDKLPFYSPA